MSGRFARVALIPCPTHPGTQDIIAGLRQVMELRLDEPGIVAALIIHDPDRERVIGITVYETVEDANRLEERMAPGVSRAIRALTGDPGAHDVFGGAVVLLHLRGEREGDSGSGAGGAP